jgi:hypothetical protein
VGGRRDVAAWVIGYRTGEVAVVVQQLHAVVEGTRDVIAGGTLLLQDRNCDVAVTRLLLLRVG